MLAVRMTSRCAGEPFIDHLRPLAGHAQLLMICRTKTLCCEQSFGGQSRSRLKSIRWCKKRRGGREAEAMRAGVTRGEACVRARTTIWRGATRGLPPLSTTLDKAADERALCC
jgi:hypothetical protein